MSKPTPPKPGNKPLADRVRESESKKVRAGGKRLPGSILPPDASEALSKLLAGAYGESVTSCIARALVDAAERLPPIRAPDKKK